MVKRAFGLVACSNVVLGVAMFLGLSVMLFGGIVVVGSNAVMINDAKRYW